MKSRFIHDGLLSYDSKRGRFKLDWRAVRPWSWISTEIGLRNLERTRPFVGGRLLDVGCGPKPYWLLFGPLVQQYVGIDRVRPNSSSRGPDVLADAQGLPFSSGSFDTVLCTEVIEHLPEPMQALAEMSRVLKPGGHLILTAPQTYWLHEEPRDFYRFTRYGLGYLVEKAGLEIQSVTAKGDIVVFGLDFLAKLLRLFVGALNRLVQLARPGWSGDLAQTPWLRWALILPQRLLLKVCRTRALDQSLPLNGDPVRLREKFTLGHTVVAMKRS